MDELTSYEVDARVSPCCASSALTPATRSTPRCWPSCSSTWRSPAATRRCGCWSSPLPTTWASPPAPTSARSSTGRAGCGGWSCSPTSTTRSPPSRSRRSPPATATCVGGGAEIAVACDMRVGGSNLRMRFPGAALGVPVGPGPPGHPLRARHGQVPAAQLADRRRRQGLRLGLVNRVAPAAATEEAALRPRRRGRRPPARGGRPDQADAARVGRGRGSLPGRGAGAGRVAAHRPRAPVPS